MHNNELEIMKYLNCWFVIVWMLSSSAFSVVDLSDVLNIKNWSKKDLLELISDSNYSINEEKLQNIKFDLESVYYIQNLSEILNKYFDWIPIPNPITEKEQENITFEKDSDYPF